MFRYFSQFLYVFPSDRLILIPWLIIFILVSSLEVSGIGIIGPFISLANNPEIIHQNSFLSFAYTGIGIKQDNHFIAIVGLLIIFIFCIKSLISWYAQARVFKFSYIQKEKLLARLVHGYLEAPYTFHLDKNSAQIINNTVQQTYHFANSILTTLLTSVSNFITIISLSILLSIISPLAVASLLFSAIILFFIFNSFKDKMTIWGQELYQSNEEIIRGINHGLGGLKETRIIGCESYFEREIVKQSQRFADASIAFYAFKLSPRFIIETLLVVFLIGFISISLMFQQNTQELTSVLGIFAIASFRLIPAFSNLTNGLSILRNSSYTLNQLYLDLKELEEVEKDIKIQEIDKAQDTINDQEISLKQEIVLDGITYHYPHASDNALRGISLKILKGQSIGLIGKSGSGKTTLVDVILGLLTPQQGDIKCDDASIYKDLRSWQKLIGYIPQNIFIIDDTIEKNIAFGVPDHLIDSHRLNQAIQAAQLTEVINNLPDGVKTKTGERGIALSGGQRQRIGIARALYHEREILVLDEATSALDNETESLVTESLKSLSGLKTMIIIAHRLTTVEHCDRIYTLERGQIVKSGSYQEVVLGDHFTN